LSTQVLDDVRVHRAELARITYRAEALAGGAVVADLVVDSRGRLHGLRATRR
jgi:hypothetical protein